MNKIQIPWEDRPVGCTDVMWRYSQNPVIGRYHIPSSNSIFNSAVVPFEDGFAGVFRCDNKAVQMNIFAGFSKDGIHWDINHEPIQFKAGNTEMIESEYKYDPRVTWIEDRYWVTWCNGYHGPTIGIAYTFDFKEFFQCENAFLPFNRNGVLFPQKIDGKYAMLSRPSDNGHTPFGDIYISYSPDMKYWGEHRCDFAFPTDGKRAEATPNTEMILVSDVDLDLLNELHTYGSVRNLKDRRNDLYEVRYKK